MFTIRQGFETNSSSSHAFAMSRDKGMKLFPGRYTLMRPMKIVHGNYEDLDEVIVHPHDLVSYLVQAIISQRHYLDDLVEGGHLKLLSTLTNFLIQLEIPYIMEDYKIFRNYGGNNELHTLDKEISYLLSDLDIFRDFLMFGEIDDGFNRQGTGELIEFPKD